MGFKSRFELATRNDLTEQEKQEIIAESQEIFRRNILCVSEIAEKNKKALLQKVGYRALQTLKFVLIALLVFVVFYQFRRIIGNFI